MLLYAMRRVQCRQCGVKVEQVPWAMGKHALTSLTDKQRISLAELLAYNLKSVRAYLLKEEFRVAPHRRAHGA